MRILTSGLDLDGFFDGLRRAPARALVLDYDGTLAPFQEKRDSSHPYPGVKEALAAIQDSCGTMLMIVSGRPADALEGLLGLHPPPELWGSHGQERTRDGRRETTGGLSDADRRAMKSLEDW